MRDSQPHRSIAVVVGAVRERAEHALAQLPPQCEAASAIVLALQTIDLLERAIADQRTDLTRQLEQLRGLGGGFGEPRIETDLAGVVSSANRAAHRFLRAPQSALMRAPLASFVPSCELDAYYDTLAHLQRSVRAAPPHGRPVGVVWNVHADVSGCGQTPPRPPCINRP